MRRIMTADNEYNRLPNNIFFFIILIAALANAFLVRMEGFLAGLIFALCAINGMITGGEYSKSRRIRLLAGLPLPVRALSTYRLYGFMFGWLLMVALLFLSSLIGRRGHLGPDYAWWILSKTGMMFVIFGCMSLMTNLFYYIKETRFNKALMRWVVGPVLITIVIIASVSYFLSIPGPGAYMEEYQINLSEMLLSFPGSSSLVILGLLFLGLDFYVFERRRSFTDDAGWPY